jgi:DNA-binding transcriptional LysR family regulator
MKKATSGQLARRITLRQLQIFEAVARLLSYTRAAQELFLSQPTVSMQVKKLESDVGLALTEQIGKKVSLTEAGHALYQAAQDILGTLSRFEMQIDDQKGLRTGQLADLFLLRAQITFPGEGRIGLSPGLLNPSPQHIGVDIQTLGGL